jgi:16S rRNA processing protein RimM
VKTIDKNDFTPIGVIQKPHGLKGETIIFYEESYEETLEEAETLFIEIEGGLVPFFVSEEGLRFRTSDSAIIQFDELNSQEKARELSGCKVYIPNEDIVETEEENELSYLIGFNVFDSQRGEIGTITGLNDFSGNVVATVQHPKAEILIPLSESIIINMDEGKKELHIDCPEGLIELYLE